MGETSDLQKKGRGGGGGEKKCLVHKISFLTGPHSCGAFLNLCLDCVPEQNVQLASRFAVLGMRNPPIEK